MMELWVRRTRGTGAGLLLLATLGAMACGDDAAPAACNEETHIECTCSDTGAMGLVACNDGVLGACRCDVPDGGDVCAADIQCDDGAFCNGVERCLPGAEDADERGCVLGMYVPFCEDDIDCTVDRCSDELNRCVHDAPDADGDGHSDASCTDADGVSLGDDCDDADPLRYPTAFEICDEDNRDEDCNPETFGKKDDDGDGAIDIACCNGDNCGDDCDDTLLARRPLQVEFCDKVDNDCDGTVDEETAEVPWFVDGDGDGFGGAGEALMSCVPIPGRSLVQTDCADLDEQRHPGQHEACDFVDNNCDGLADEGKDCGTPLGMGFPVGQDGGAVGGGAGGGGGSGGVGGTGGMGSGGMGSGGMGSGGGGGGPVLELMECPVDRDVTSATEVSGSISGGSQTWSGLVHMTGDVRVYGDGHLIIMPGTTVIVDPGAILYIGYSGTGARVTAAGTEQAPIRLCGKADLPGYWEGVRIGPNSDPAGQMSWVLIADGGELASALHVQASVPLTDVHVRNAREAGIEAETFGVGSARLFSTENGLPMVIADDQAMTRLPVDSVWTGNASDVIEIRDTSWTTSLTVHDPGVPYLIKNGLRMQGDQTYQFDANAHFQVEVDGFVEVGWNSNTSSLQMNGTADAPIVFEGRIQDPGSWAGIRISGAVRTASYVHHLTVRHAGNAGVGAPALEVRAPIEMTHITLEDNFGTAMRVEDSGLKPSSNNISITGTVGNPLVIQADAATKLGTSVAIAGNTYDRIEFEQNTHISTTGTIRGFGVPYYIPFGTTVRGTTQLTIAPGAEFHMGNDTSFLVGWNANAVTISAVGTAQAPIVFKHETGADGLWEGVQLEGNVSTASKLQYVHFEDGGSSGFGSLYIRMGNTLPAANLTNCEFNGSAAYGLYLTKDYMVDYTQNGNVFDAANVAGDVNF